MGKSFITLFIAGCLGGGACLSSLEVLSQGVHYRNALEDPDFYHLVDEVGNPVGKLPNKPLR